MLTKQDARGAILGYYVLYREKKVSQEPPWENTTVDGANTTSYVVASLNKFTSYELAIQAFNSKGASVMSDVIERTTDEDGKSFSFSSITLIIFSRLRT